ncbi:unnamed protein product [Sphagnum balticum]
MVTAPKLSLWQARRSHRLPTDPLIRQRKACKAPTVPNTLLSESLLSEKGKNVGQAPADSIALSESEKC